MTAVRVAPAHILISEVQRVVAKHFNLTWGDVAGARIEIEPAPEWVTRRNAAKVVSP